MFRIIIFLISAAYFFNFGAFQAVSTTSPQTLQAVLDTVPLKVDEALIQELTGDLQEKTWRDSGYYFQLENILWRVQRLGTVNNGDVIVLTSFSSADPSSLRFQGQAVFRFDPDDWPGSVSPSKGMQGEAIVAFPQDVLLCPSPSQEVGLGQNDPYFPLYLSGEITGVKSGDGGFVSFQAPISVQLRDIEIIL